MHILNSVYFNMSKGGAIYRRHPWLLERIVDLLETLRFPERITQVKFSFLTYYNDHSITNQAVDSEWCRIDGILGDESRFPELKRFHIEATVWHHWNEGTFSEVPSSQCELWEKHLHRLRASGRLESEIINEELM
jgi:hypothetical protein